MARAVLLLMVFLGIGNCAIAQDTLRLLTWNIQMLPFPVPPHGKGKRAKAIAELLKNEPYDVVVFQEAFKRRSRRILRRELRQAFPHQTDVLNQKTLAVKVSGGVMLLSKHPIDSVHEIRFTHRTGFDKYARKGALMAELRVKGKPIQVLGTHLQAFGRDSILIAQYKQIRDEILATRGRHGVPQFICGDMNTRPNSARYPAMLETFGAQSGDLYGDQQFTMDRPNNDLTERNPSSRIVLDYILVRPANTNLSIRRQVRIFRKQWDKEHQDLSDHFALEALVTGY